MGKGKILVTPRSISANGHPSLAHLKGAGYQVLSPFPGKMPTEGQLLEALPECIGYLAGVEKIDGKLLGKCPNLLVISRNGVGIDNVDRESAEKMGIALRTTPGANSRGVAELTIGLIFSLVRSIPQVNQSVQSGGWNRPRGLEIQGKTLGVIGTGMIGEQVALLGAALGMKIIAYDLYPSKSLSQKAYVHYTSLNELLSKSDIVTLHCPAGDKALIDEKNITLIKQGSYLVNTARSALVDEAALLSSLETGKLSGYAVDAFEKEPPKLSPLLLHNRVIATAHIGGNTAESVDRAANAAVKNILDVLEKSPLI